MGYQNCYIYFQYDLIDTIEQWKTVSEKVEWIDEISDTGVVNTKTPRTY